MGSPDSPEDPSVGDAMEELEELEGLVDSPEEREQVREAMRTLRRTRPRPFGRLRSAFGLRDVGEALVGSVLFGIPMVVEAGPSTRAHTSPRGRSHWCLQPWSASGWWWESSVQSSSRRCRPTCCSA
jgi:hypothetical protein